MAALPLNRRQFLGRAAALAALGAVGGAPEILTACSSTSPAPESVMSFTGGAFRNSQQATITIPLSPDTFVAEHHTQSLTVEIAASVAGWGDAIFALAVGVPAVPGAPLLGETAGGPHGFPAATGASAVQQWQLGAIRAETRGPHQLSKRVGADGLVPGRRYQVQLVTSAVGSSKSVPAGVQPTHVRWTPDGGTIVCANYGSGTLSVVNAGGQPGWSERHQQGPASLARTVALPGPGAAPFRLAIVPGTTWVLVSDTRRRTVSLADWASGHVVASSLALPSGAVPYGIGVSRAGKDVFVAASDGRVHRLGLPTLVAGEPIPVSPGHTLYDAEATADGDRLWVADLTGGALVPVDLTGGTVGAPVAVGGLASKPVVVRVGTDGSAWAGCGGTNVIQQVRPDLSLGASARPTYPPGLTSGLTDLALSGPDEAMWWAAIGPFVVYGWTRDGTEFDHPTFGRQDAPSVDANGDGYVAVALWNANRDRSGQVWQWPSNVLTVNPAAGGYARVVVGS